MDQNVQKISVLHHCNVSSNAYHPTRNPDSYTDSYADYAYLGNMSYGTNYVYTYDHHHDVIYKR